jgi:hypothetical protein
LLLPILVDAHGATDVWRFQSRLARDWFSINLGEVITFDRRAVGGFAARRRAILANSGRA